LRGEPELSGCLAGYKFFYLDWHLDLYRHNWDRPMCHITGFDEVERVRDGRIACMIDCYCDDSVMQHIGVAIGDGVAAAASGRVDKALRHWFDRRIAPLSTRFCKRRPAPPRLATYHTGSATEIIHPEGRDSLSAH
jgi:hypothetical protein